MDFIPLVQMAVLVFAVINFIKYLRESNTNGWFTQLVVWVAGVLVVMLVAQTDFAEGIVIGDMSLATMNIWSLIFVGLTIASLATFGTEIKKALDGSDSATMPRLLDKPGGDPPA